MSSLKKALFHTKTSSFQLSMASLLLRIGFGILMIPNHGWKKLQNFEKVSQDFMSFMGLSSSISLGLCIFAEFFCSILLILGLMTRWAVIPLIITMLVIFNQHNWELIGKYELATAFFIGYIAILFLGGGKFSLDAMIYKNRR